MSAERQVPEPGESIYAPTPSWAPAFFAFALALAVCGVFISFMFPGWVYSVVGVVVALFALRSMVRSASEDYFRQPRKQHVRGAVLPVETVSPPRP